MLDIKQYQYLFSKEELNAVLGEKDLYLSKQNGQNFLVDAPIRQKLSSFIPNNKPILEVGPGLGHFTIFLLQKTPQLLGVEIDRGFFGFLTKKFPQEHIHFLHNDVLKITKDDLAPHLDLTQNPIVVGNIPYNITKDITLHLLGFFPLFDEIYLLLDKSFVDDKLKPNTPSFAINPLYVLIESFYDIEILARVSMQCFFPIPKKHSSFLRLKKKPHPLLPTYSRAYQKWVYALFLHQNKKLPNDYKINGKERVHEFTVADIWQLWQEGNPSSPS